MSETGAPESSNASHDDAPPSARAQHRAAVVRWLLIAAFAVLAAAGVSIGIGVFEAPAVGQSVIWTCPMHPQVRQDHPADCPICGMHLVRAEPAPPARTDRPRPRGHAAVNATQEQLRRIGVVVTPVERSSIADTLRAPGRVELDPRSVSVVDVRLGGWLRNVRVRAVGVRVRRGQLLARLESTELYQAESELAAARRSVGALGNAGSAVLTSASARLAALGVPVREISRVAAGGPPQTSLSVIAPRSGQIVELTAAEGAFVAPGTPLFTIADTGRLWVVASVPAASAARLAVGASARIESDVVPGRSLEGHVVLLDPSVDPTTRTRGVRVEVARADAALVPGTDATVSFESAARDALLVPADSVLPGQGESYVYVELAPGDFEPRAVRVGATVRGRTEILSGLDGSERVASVGAFMLDAESRLRAVGSAAGPSGAAAPTPATGHAGHGSN